MRRLMFRSDRLAAIGPLVQALAEIGAAHGGKTAAQVALNWLICQGNTLPIPGVKSKTQANQNAGALGWRLTDEQVDSLPA
jgi:aryl-alcohol dehydrogenase-like predicted oxidoreductase